MKKLMALLLLIIIFSDCSTTKNVYDDTFKNALIGQDEMTIRMRLGTPTRTEPGRNGGKILVYEMYSKGMYLTPYKSAIKYKAEKNVVGEREGWVYTFGEHTAANDPKYTIHQQNVSALKIILNKEGKCTRYEQNLPREQLDIYHERFSHFDNIK